MRLRFGGYQLPNTKAQRVLYTHRNAQCPDLSPIKHPMLWLGLQGTPSRGPLFDPLPPILPGKKVYSWVHMTTLKSW